jgi:hypothetical protein
MTAKWGMCAILVIGLTLTVGCRTRQPELKPEKTAEKLVDPPTGGRYDTTGLPKQAFDKLDDPMKSAFDAKATPGVSGRSASGGGMGGSPGH